jgi:hypothetical protein
MDDGSVMEAVVDQRDYRRYDLTRSSHKWPAATDAPFLLQGFVCAAALIRQGDVDETDPVVVMDRIVEVVETGSSDVTPTAAGHGPASSLS